MTEGATFYVYLISRLDGTPCYVGKGKGQRWRHNGKAGRNLHFLRIIRKAKAAGRDLPKVKIAENLTEAEAFRIEREMIAKIGREANGGPLVNLTDGGDGTSGYRPSEETRAKMRAARKDFQHSSETRAAISAALKGKPKSPEHAAKVGAANKGKNWTPSAEHIEHLRRLAAAKVRQGTKHSDEALAKIRTARARQPKHVSPETQFKSGAIPWNAGMKGYNPSPATQFKKGYKPSSTTRAKLSAAVTASWAKRKAVSLNQNLT